MDEKVVVINIAGGGNEETQVNDPTSVTDKTTAQKCLSSIKDKLSLISPDTQNYGTLCIYKVPEKHRKKNEEAYAPRSISIGLVHHGETKLQAMEEYKLKYLNNFLDTFQVPLWELVQHVDGEERKLCGCYEDIYVQKLVEKSRLPSEVILLYSIFILELFLKNYFVKLREKGDVVFDNSMVSNEILHDLLLFENQLPFRFLSTLYDTFVGSKVGNVSDDDPIICSPSFNELAHKYFRNVGNTGKLSLRRRDYECARHFVEFLSILHMPGDKEWAMEMKETHNHVEKKPDSSLCPTATELRAVGVKFQKGTGSCLMNIKFDSSTGVLKIPPLTVNGSTETFFRNLIAFEQSGYHSKYTTSFVMLLDYLIDTPKDVDVLIKHEIIKNELAGSEQVADLFNTLYKEFLADPKEFYFAEECGQLNAYSRHYWHKLKAELESWVATIWAKYFSTPWSFCSLIAAVAILALTATQTAYAIKSFK